MAFSSIYVQCLAGWVYLPTGLRTWVILSLILAPSQRLTPQPLSSLVLRCGLELMMNQLTNARAIGALSFHPWEGRNRGYLDEHSPGHFLTM